MNNLNKRLESLSRSTSPLALVASSILKSTSKQEALPVEAQYKAVANAFKTAGIDMPEYSEEPSVLLKGILTILIHALPKLTSDETLINELVRSAHPTVERIEEVEQAVTEFRQSLISPSKIFTEYSRVQFFEEMEDFEKALYAKALLDFCAVKKLTPVPLWNNLLTGA